MIAAELLLTDGVVSECVGVGAGAGAVELRRVGDSTAVVRRLARSPLKLLTPRGPGAAAHVVTSTYGGGLLPGDDIRLDVDAGEGTRVVLGTQASTKVYRGESGAGARQSLRAVVRAGAMLAVVPDPVTCFAGARYEQRQRFELEENAALVLVDWLTAGRVACGERWAMRRYLSDTRVSVDGSCVARDALRLDPDDGPIDAPHRTGRFDCLATVMLVGEAFAPAAGDALRRVNAVALRRRAGLLASASPLPSGYPGAVVRVAGGGTEAVGRFARELLTAAWETLGENPWARRW
jgi:urease accessory protein